MRFAFVFLVFAAASSAFAGAVSLNYYSSSVSVPYKDTDNAAAGFLGERVSTDVTVTCDGVDGRPYTLYVSGGGSDIVQGRFLVEGGVLKDFYGTPYPSGYLVSTDKSAQDAWAAQQSGSSGGVVIGVTYFTDPAGNRHDVGADWTVTSTTPQYSNGDHNTARHLTASVVLTGAFPPTPTPSPTPTATPPPLSGTPTPTPTPTPSGGGGGPTPTPNPGGGNPTPTPPPTGGGGPTPTPPPGSTPTPTPTATPSPAGGATPTPTPGPGGGSDPTPTPGGPTPTPVNQSGGGGTGGSGNGGGNAGNGSPGHNPGNGGAGGGPGAGTTGGSGSVDAGGGGTGTRGDGGTNFPDAAAPDQDVLTSNGKYGDKPGEGTSSQVDGIRNLSGEGKGMFLSLLPSIDKFTGKAPDVSWGADATPIYTWTFFLGNQLGSFVMDLNWAASVIAALRSFVLFFILVAFYVKSYRVIAQMFALLGGMTGNDKE